jgi:hypothetical protein
METAGSSEIFVSIYMGSHPIRDHNLLMSPLRECEISHGVRPITFHILTRLDQSSYIESDITTESGSLFVQYFYKQMPSSVSY